MSRATTKPGTGELWAKSIHATRGVLSLLQHSCDAETAAMALFGPGTRWGPNFCRFFGIDGEPERQRFLLNLRVAGLFHDIGKANQGFQDAVRPAGDRFGQSLRHEHLSALVLCLDSVRGWLGQNPALDVDAITAAVLSHHLKARESGDHGWCNPRDARPKVALHFDHGDVAAILERVRAAAGLPELPAIPRQPWSPRPPWTTVLRQGVRYARQFDRAVKKDPARNRFMLAVKAGLIAADSAASGLFRTGRSISEWIEEVARKTELRPGDLDDAILNPRARQLAGAGARFQDIAKPFQRGAAGLGPRALLLAGCGSGKTLAAWNWARAQLHSQDLGHVAFLYPTRGTATEGFRDYVGWAPESDAALLHGTAEYELEGMYRNPSEATRDKRYETEQRLFALGLWPRRYFSATVDQFLAFLEHRYESLCLLPLLADSAVILDEVHSYDRAMFDNLIAFLRSFDVPVLCMTATLPPSRRRELEDAGLTVYPGPEHRSELVALEAAENHPRYRIQLHDAGEPLVDRAVTGYRAGSRVLWVVNTVARCQALASELAERLGEPVLAYHSRFRLMDRATQHQRTVDAFQQRDRPAIAVTTQVCEMSLDLDADVLITEQAPVASVVQRLGRANRHAARGLEFRADIHIYPPANPDNPLPYRRSDLAATRDFLAAIQRLTGGEVSQRQLAEAFEAHSLREPLADGRANFLASGYYATPGSFREDDAFSVQCVLDRDLACLEPHAHDRAALRSHLPGYQLAVPGKHVIAEFDKPSWLPGHLAIAPGDHYDEALGFVIPASGGPA